MYSLYTGTSNLRVTEVLLREKGKLPHLHIMENHWECGFYHSLILSLWHEKTDFTLSKYRDSFKVAEEILEPGHEVVKKTLLSVVAWDRNRFTHSITRPLAT